MKKVLSVFLAVVLCFLITIPAFAADGKVTITNPYAKINWSKTNQYKTALHSHTNASDGDQTLKESIRKHIESGFDIVAISDHGINDIGWNPEKDPAFSKLFKLIGRSDGELDYLSSSGKLGKSISYKYYTSKNGDDYLKLGNGKKILRVPYAIENNAVSVNAHVNSWFVPYHDNSITTYEDALKGVSNANGVCVINHPGEYTKAKNELTSEAAYNESNTAYAYYINKYATLIDKYDNCIGIDMNSKGDARTRYDRILWDKLLERFSAKGKNVFGIASSDAHRTSIIDSGYVVSLLPSLTSSNLRSALEKGEFIAASHCIGNYDELVQIASAIKKYYGKTDVYKAVSKTAKEMKAEVEAIQNGEKSADDKLSTEYTLLDENGCCKAKTTPKITSIKTDNKSGQITIKTKNALIVRWISNGKLIETDKADNASFDVLKSKSKIGDYIRAEVFGEGGILYTQAFLINAEQKDSTAKVTNGSYADLGIFDFLLAELRNAATVVKIWFSSKF